MENVISPTLTAVNRLPIPMSTAQKNQVQNAVTSAQTMVQRAIANSAHALGVISQPGNDAFNLGTNFGTALRGSFGITTNDFTALTEPTLMYIGPMLVKIANGLHAPLDIVDLSVGYQIANVYDTITNKGVTAGYLRGAGMVRSYGHAQAPGRIHIDFGRLGNVIDVARTIVHEASHKFCGTRDHAYHPNLGTLSNVNAKNNADSIAYFAAAFVVNPALTYNN